MPCFDLYDSLHDVNGAPLFLSGSSSSFSSACLPRAYCHVGEELFFSKVDGSRRSFLLFL